MREPLTAIQAAMLRAAVKSSMAHRKPAFAPLELIPQSTKANTTFVPKPKRRVPVSRVTTTGSG